MRRNSSAHPVMKKGVTIIELLIAILIVGMLSLGLAYMITSGLKVWSGGQKRTEMMDQGRISVERVSRELRQAVRNTIATYNDTDVKFNAILGGNTTYIVEYKLSGTALQRSEKTSSGAADDFVNIAESVNNLNIVYYNNSGGTPSTANEIRTVRVTLIMDMPAPEQDVNLTTEVQLRNFKTTGE
ncbi:MAG: prepilin-type N-terminal cleavage/methylation domain-containing protein [Candidatus Omnitrophica bacterium]|nr:prepilin-type N-terminal cleavage/methylation domain-containing protein [Candidatus Omnitrophota bacterium]